MRQRRGSALVLVLLMTLAVAALAIAAIFMTSSAGLLSRFYDKERLYRLAAESALEFSRSRLTNDLDLAIPDTGMMQLMSGWQPTDASGTVVGNVSVNVYAAVTGDSSGAYLPYVTLLAAAYDASGTRHVRRMDLERESFSRYTMFADSFPTSSGFVFGPGTVTGRVHSNQTWRSGTGSSSATYEDSVSTVSGFVGTGTYHGDTLSGVASVPYPRDSTYALMTSRASAANLSFAVSGAGSRIEFVAFDADADGTIEESEGFFKVWDLAAGGDTSKLAVSVAPTDIYNLFGGAPTGKYWNDPVIQNQCGAMYYRSNRWQFFPVAVHRTAWGRNAIQKTGGSNYPSINGPTMDGMDSYTYAETATILQQSTARCFPAGSPYLVNTERFTNTAGSVTGTAADTVPFGVLLAAGAERGGEDTTFTQRSRTCTIATASTTGHCNTGTISTLGTWRIFSGTAVTGIAATVRQAGELSYLWPINTTRNSGYRGVMRFTSTPVWVSGTVRGRVTLYADGAVRLMPPLTLVNAPSDPDAEECADQLGIVAVGDVLVADNITSRARRVANSLFSASSFTRHFGQSKDVALHGAFMSLTGTVGYANYSTAAPTTWPCPQDSTSTRTGGCFRLAGSMIMRRFTPLNDGSTGGARYDGVGDRCSSTSRRPPFFPLTNRYTEIRNIEVEASEANNPTKIRALLMRLKGKR